MVNRRGVLAAAATATAIAAAGGAIAYGAVASKSGEPTHSAAVSPPIPDALVAQAVSRFSALGAPSAAVPAQVREVARTMLPGAAATVHRLSASSDFAYYVVRSHGQLCDVIELGARPSGSGCFRDPAALAAGDVGPTVTKIADGFRITALVPDGTSSVALRWRSGPDQPIEIVNNVVAVAVEQLPEAIEWTTPSGARRSFSIGRDLLEPPNE
jgi:hypothetical protein